LADERGGPGEYANGSRVARLEPFVGAAKAT